MIIYESHDENNRKKMTDKFNRVPWNHNFVASSKHVMHGQILSRETFLRQPVL